MLINDMIEAVRQFIKDKLIFDINYIWQGYQNKITPPKEPINFIILTPLYKIGLTSIPEWEFDDITTLNKFTDLKSATIQIDIYGDNAFNNADKLNLLFKTKANEYFYDNNYACSMHDCSQQMNMTDVLEENYLNRQMMKLELFDNTQIITDDGYIATVDFDLLFADAQE